MFSRRLLLVVAVLAVSLAAPAYFQGPAGAMERSYVGFDRVEVVTYASGLTAFLTARRARSTSTTPIGTNVSPPASSPRCARR
jgi:hypothetical protein